MLFTNESMATGCQPSLAPWKKELLDHAIQPIQQFSNTMGKNSSDSALIIDAMDLLYQNDLDAFCIVSSDSDFTRLATCLRESDIFVLGMGEQKTPRAFISACNKFVYLDVLEESHKRETSKSNPRTRKRTNAAPERTKQDQTSTTDSSDRRKQVRSERLDISNSSGKGSMNEAILPAETQAEEPAVYSDGTDIIDDRCAYQYHRRITMTKADTILSGKSRVTSLQRFRYS